MKVMQKTMYLFLIELINMYSPYCINLTFYRKINKHICNCYELLIISQLFLLYGETHMNTLIKIRGPTLY